VLDTVGNIVHIFYTLSSLITFAAAFQQAAVKIEYVTRISFTSWRATQQQGYFAVSHSLLRQIIIDDQGRTAGIAEELTDGGTGKWSIELLWSRIRSQKPQRW
jgi:hypothetical protein